eukprot:scaffold6103_cov65-Phaeocystis_antarctica.AAC.4
MWSTSALSSSAGSAAISRAASCRLSRAPQPSWLLGPSCPPSCPPPPPPPSPPCPPLPAPPAPPPISTTAWRSSAPNTAATASAPRREASGACTCACACAASTLVVSSSCCSRSSLSMCSVISVQNLSTEMERRVARTSKSPRSCVRTACRRVVGLLAQRAPRAVSRVISSGSCTTSTKPAKAREGSSESAASGRASIPTRKARSTPVASLSRAKARLAASARERTRCWPPPSTRWLSASPPPSTPLRSSGSAGRQTATACGVSPGSTPCSHDCVRRRRRPCDGGAAAAVPKLVSSIASMSFEMSCEKRT